ncbi:hypothetical protein KY285_016592 [Solanum tuberosum]|nr:hypothetical protein KY284_016602 [Solanum tuberosum]KAH0702314.1 hypothetical protein KY285_016592 [Solanum tuberosum]
MANDMKEIKDMFNRMTLELANFTVRQNQSEEQQEKAIAGLRESLTTIQKADRGKRTNISEGPSETYTPSGNPMVWTTSVSVGNPPGFLSPGGYQYGTSQYQQYQTPVGEQHHQQQGYSRGQQFFAH